MGGLPSGVRAIDFDTHYYETEDCFSRHIERRFRDDAIHLEAKDGQRTWVMGDYRICFIPETPCDSVPPPGFLADYFAGKVDFSDAYRSTINPLRDHPEMTSRPARLRMMDEQAIDAIIALSSATAICDFEFRDRPEALCANFRSFNRWVEEEWGFGADGRVFGIPIVSLLDLDWAVAEVERLAALGSRLVNIPAGPWNGRSPGEPYFDPFWARIQEAGIRPIYHIGNDGFAYLYGALWGEDPTRQLVDYSPFQQYIGFGQRSIEDSLAALILHNLFGRFPDVEVLSIENGSEWIGAFLKELDRAASHGGSGIKIGGELTDAPSELFKRHVHVVPYHEDDIVALCELLGRDRVLFGSDWPHPEGLKNPLDFAHGLRQLDQSGVRSVMRDNGARLLGLATSAELLTGARVR
jgi:predicted TIM-barrel fold metal-dependent hydrolase